MQKRTFIRTMMDIFFDNAMVKSIASVVNFCNEQRYYGSRELKFLKNMPINNTCIDNNKYLFSGAKLKTGNGKV